MTSDGMDGRGLAILGSTGSIGRSTLELLDLHPGWFRVVALTAGSRVEALAEQVRRYRPRVAAIADPLLGDRLKELCADTDCEVFAGPEGLVRAAAASGADLVLAAIVGGAGLAPTYRAVEAGIPVALANKEALVMAGSLMVDAAGRAGVPLLPVDSEHNALHQCLRGEKVEEVRRLILTASGGPFRTTPIEELRSVRREQALRHPTWEMGPKITIDSATLMNKGLEVIEAHWLFGLPADRIRVLIHPQSLVHSMVEFVDGSVMAQMGVNDMKHPIQYALTYPERRTAKLPPLDLTSSGAFTFEEVDREKFPCLDLAYRALRAGGTSPAALNAANEVAVAAFLGGDLPFQGIAEIVDGVLQDHTGGPASSLEEILEADRKSRRDAERYVERRMVC